MNLARVRLIQPVFTRQAILIARQMSGGEKGSGVGKGGGAGGAIRDAGGAFGKRQTAKEEEYFRNLSKSQVDALKTSFQDEINYHEDEIKDHKEELERHKRKLEELKKIAESKD